MLRRIGFFLVGGWAVHQAQLIYPHGVTFNGVLTHFIFDPFDLISISLLFLIGFLMLSPFFEHFLKLSYLLKRKQAQIHGGDILEFLVFAAVLFVLFHYGFWLTLLSALFALSFGWFSSDLRIEREVEQARQDLDH